MRVGLCIKLPEEALPCGSDRSRFGGPKELPNLIDVNILFRVIVNSSQGFLIMGTTNVDVMRAANRFIAFSSVLSRLIAISRSSRLIGLSKYVLPIVANRQSGEATITRRFIPAYLAGAESLSIRSRPRAPRKRMRKQIILPAFAVDESFWP